MKKTTTEKKTEKNRKNKTCKRGGYDWVSKKSKVKVSNSNSNNDSKTKKKSKKDKKKKGN
jgi:hypothetical protein